jgi:hypothetical protein
MVYRGKFLLGRSFLLYMEMSYHLENLAKQKIQVNKKIG